jgi:N4-gp56 family major capsid protein
MANIVTIAGGTTGNFTQLPNEILDVYSQEILFQAQPVMRFESVAQVRTELQTTPGSTIKFLRYASLTGKSDIAETNTIEAQALSTSLVSLTVTEHAKAVSVTELLLRQAADDVLTRAATTLGMHYAKDRDRLCRDTLLTSANVLYSQAGGVATTRAGLTANSKFNVDLIRDAVEQLSTNKAPKFGGDAYVCFVHPHQARALRSDPAWVNVNQYNNGGAGIFNGEIGRIEDVRFIETTMVTRIVKSTQQIWADNINTGDTTAIAANAATDVYQALIVGDWALGLAEALPVEMRDNGVEDYGRKHSVAYYGIWGCGLIESGHVFVLETA